MSRLDWPADLDGVATEAERILGRSLRFEEVTYCWEFSEECAAICVLKYYPQERGGFAHPDHAEQCVLQHCFVAEADIERFIAPYWRRRVEGLALDLLLHERRIQECEEFDAEGAL